MFLSVVQIKGFSNAALKNTACSYTNRLVSVLRPHTRTHTDVLAHTMPLLLLGITVWNEVALSPIIDTCAYGKQSPRGGSAAWREDTHTLILTYTPTSTELLAAALPTRLSRRWDCLCAINNLESNLESVLVMRSSEGLWNWFRFDIHSCWCRNHPLWMKYPSCPPPPFFVFQVLQRSCLRMRRCINRSS